MGTAENIRTELEGKLGNLLQAYQTESALLVWRRASELRGAADRRLRELKGDQRSGSHRRVSLLRHIVSVCEEYFEQVPDSSARWKKLPEGLRLLRGLIESFE